MPICCSDSLNYLNALAMISLQVMITFVSGQSMVRGWFWSSRSTTNLENWTVLSVEIHFYWHGTDQNSEVMILAEVSSFAMIPMVILTFVLHVWIPVWYRNPFHKILWEFYTFSSGYSNWKVHLAFSHVHFLLQLKQMWQQQCKYWILTESKGYTCKFICMKQINWSSVTVCVAIY